MPVKYVTIPEEVQALMCMGKEIEEIREFCEGGSEDIRVYREGEEGEKIFVETTKGRIIAIDYNTVILKDDFGRLRGISLKAFKRGYRQK